MPPKFKITDKGELYVSESQMQTSCVRWFRIVHPALSGLLFSIPNGAKMGGKTNKKGFPIQASIMKGEGLTEGVADLFLALPKGRFSGLFIEMKTPVGSLSPEQRSFLERMAAVGYAVALCRSQNDFEKVIVDYLAGTFVQVGIWVKKRPGRGNVATNKGSL